MAKQDVKEQLKLIEEYFKDYRSRKKLNKTSHTEIRTNYYSTNYQYN